MTSVATVMIFITTAIYTYYAKKQWQEMKSGGADTHELAVQAKNQADRTKDVADAAGKEADAARAAAESTRELAQRALVQAQATNEVARQAKRSAEIATKSLEIQERPWVGLRNFNVKTDVATGAFKASVVVQNSGRGAAIHAHASYWLNPHICGKEIPTSLPHPPAPGPEQFATLMPGAAVELQDVTVDIPEPRFKQLSSGECYLLLYGTITYCDVLDNFHYQRFCGMWNPQSKREFLQCAPHNDGDQDHPEEKPQRCFAKLK